MIQPPKEEDQLDDMLVHYQIRKNFEVKTPRNNESKQTETLQPENGLRFPIVQNHEVVHDFIWFKT